MNQLPTSSAATERLPASSASVVSGIGPRGGGASGAGTGSDNGVDMGAAAGSNAGVGGGAVTGACVAEVIAAMGLSCRGSRFGGGKGGRQIRRERHGGKC